MDGSDGNDNDNHGDDGDVNNDDDDDDDEENLLLMMVVVAMVMTATTMTMRLVNLMMVSFSDHDFGHAGGDVTVVDAHATVAGPDTYAGNGSFEMAL